MPKRSIPPEPDADPLWQRTPYANLVRYVPSDKYFARVRVAGKLIRRSLKTTVLSVAKLKLADFEKAERAKTEANGRVVDGKATVGDLIAEYRTHQLTLPTQPQFLALVDEIRRVPFGPGLASADLVEFLAYSGLRQSEAANVNWGDCDMTKREILVRGDAQTGPKNSEVRRVPMIPDMVPLLQTLAELSRADAHPSTPLLSQPCRWGCGPASKLGKDGRTSSRRLR